MGNATEKLKIPAVEIACCYSSIEKKELDLPVKADVTDAGTCTSEDISNAENPDKEIRNT